MTGPEWRDGDPPPGPSGGARFQGPGAASPDPASPPSRRMPASFAGSPLQQTPSRAFNSPSAAGLGSPAKTGEAVTVTLAATTPGSFSASAKYHKGLIDLYKTMLSRAWDPEMRAWTFAVEERAQLVEKLHNAPFPVRIEDNVAEGAVRLSQVEAEAAEDTLPAAEVEGRISDNIGPDIWNKLFKFQQAGVRICVRRRARCMIADEMGLGKTVQAICVASCFPESWPLLIVCPSSVRLVWLEALLNWLPPKLLPAPDNLVVISSSKDIEKKLQLSADPEKKSAVIVSYELVQKLDRYAYRYPFVICDESHALKSRESNRTKFVSGLVRHVRHAVLITGTPLLSKPVELFAQIDMLRPGMFGDWDAFGQRYCGGKKTRAAPNAPLDYRGASNLVELNAILERSLMIRRLKKDVLQDLPPKQRCSVPITMDPAFLKDVEAINQELAKLDRNPGGKSSDVLDVERQQLINQLYTASGPAKVKEAWDHITNILERDEKVLVFAHHVAVLDMLADACATTRPAPTRFVRIDGSVGDGKRNEAVNQFQNDPRIRLALLSITAAGVGITLTAASVVVFAELFWNPGHLIQAEDRAHRLGQAGSIQVHYLLAPGSIDDIIWRTVQKKLQVVGRALDGNMAGTATGLNVTDTAAIERYADLAARSHLDNLGTPADPNGPSTSRTAAPDGQAHRNAPAGPDSARRFSTGVFGDDAEMDDWDAAVLSSQEVERVSQSQQQARQQAPPPQPAAELPEEPEEPPASGGGAQRRKRGRSPEATPPARPWSAAGPVESADVIELD
ncbi:hypothetical protein WJX72_000259 [[Myrmecia] bisecta]|uniref:SWI/SNF-related matrix-associated actin-dependent regulator of chromatin subfamily A-like protein 1 n=1 Tax=[Myrmecia] bisecta TaxID=41462 RepID=A0AAW1P8S2_9CHLO